MEELFNLVKNYGEIVRTKKLNGQDSWNEMEKLLLTIIPCDGLTWSINLVNLDEKHIDGLENTYYYVHDTLGMIGENTDPRDNNWEKFHFFLQLVRIPFKNRDCNLVKLAQVAYNLGQLSIEYKDDIVYTPKVKRFYEMNNLGEMSTYTKSSCDLSAEDLQKIRQQLDSKRSGSGYLHKYLKYKKKYLQLKK
jgi:hypothetical protein